MYWVCILMCLISGIICQECNQNDPCAPVYPCQLDSVMSQPANCEVYKECVAPYEYVTTNVECGGNKGSFSNNTCTCDPIFECHTWECPPSSITPEPPIQSAPCFLEVVECLTAYVTVPDRYYCTKYFECDGGEWLSRTCPPDAQYYDVTLPFLNPPCRNNVARCDSILFDECLDFTTKHVTTNPTTTQPTTTYPTTTQPTTTDPTTTQPITTDPTTTQPFTTNPTTTQPTTTDPTTTQPTTTDPTTTQPTTTDPTTTQPSTTNPTTTQPTTTDPTTTQPTTTDPTTTQPITTDPTTTQPTTTDPTTTQPATTNPTPTQPTATNPTTTQPTIAYPTTTQPTTTDTTTTQPTTTYPTTTGHTTTSTSDSTTPVPSTTKGTTSQQSLNTTIKTPSIEPTTSVPIVQESTSSRLFSSDATDIIVNETEPTKLTFSMSTLLTTHPWSSVACEALGACTNGHRVAHIYECSVFFQCVDGIWEEHNCEQINSKKPVYNPMEQECQKKFMVDCAVRCNLDGIRLEKSTRNIVIIVMCCFAGIVAIILIAVFACQNTEEDSYDYTDLNGRVTGKSTNHVPAPPPANPIVSPDYVYHVSPPLPSQPEIKDVELVEYIPIHKEIIDPLALSAPSPKRNSYVEIFDERAAIYRPTDIDDIQNGREPNSTITNPIYLESMADGPRPTQFGLMDL